MVFVAVREAMEVKSIVLVVALSLSSLLPAAAIAQGQWTVGQHVKVFYPRPGGAGPAWRTGVVTEVFGWGVHMKFDDQDHVESFGNGDVMPVGGGVVAAPPVNTTPAPKQAAPQQAAPQPVRTGSCTTDPGVVAGARGNLAAQIKHAIYANYAAEVNGTLSAPLAIGLTFQSFQVGAPLPNRVGPAGYEYPNAVRGSPVYPVTTQHTYCRQYRNATNRTLFAGRYVCFQTRFGNGMECGTAEGHRLIGYQ